MFYLRADGFIWYFVWNIWGLIWVEISALVFYFIRDWVGDLLRFRAG